MSITRREDIISLSGKLQLTITHFGKGTYDLAKGNPRAFPVNRFIIPLDDPDPAANFVRTEKDHIPMKAGMGYFIPIFQKAGVALHPELNFLTVQFHCELFSAMDLFAGQNSIFCFPADFYRGEMEKAIQAKNTLRGLLIIQSMLYRFIADHPGKFRMEKNDSLHLMARYREIWKYVVSRPPGEIRVTDLARFYPWRRETFTRHFTRDMGISPKEYLQKNLLAHACELLAGNELLVREIAGELGFENEYYFSRFFRKHMGFSPLAYRKNKHF